MVEVGFRGQVRRKTGCLRESGELFAELNCFHQFVVIVQYSNTAGGIPQINKMMRCLVICLFLALLQSKQTSSFSSQSLSIFFHNLWQVHQVNRPKKGWVVLFVTWSFGASSRALSKALPTMKSSTTLSQPVPSWPSTVLKFARALPPQLWWV